MSVADRLRRSDAALILGTMLAVYGAFTILSLLLGFGLNGLFNALRRITYLTAVFAMASLALNLQWGYTGLFNIGVAGFMAVGVYAFAMATAAPTATIPGLGLPFVVGVAVGMTAAGAFGFLAALPALRLRADYLAIVTIAFSEIVRLVFLSTAFQTFAVGGVELGTGSGRGIAYPQSDAFVVSLLLDNPVGAAVAAPVRVVVRALGITDSVFEGWVYAAVLVLAVWAFYWFLSRAGASPFGRVLKAIREDEDVARALGKPTQRFKITAFVVGCALLGLVGVLWKGTAGFVTPGNFLPQVTFFFWVALIVGGAGSNTGSVLGGALFVGLLFEGPRTVATILDTVLSVSFPGLSAPPSFAGAVGPLFAANPLPLLAYAIGNINALRLVLMGVVLVVLMQRRPRGLLGHRKEIAASVDLSRPGADDE